MVIRMCMGEFIMDKLSVSDDGLTQTVFPNTERLLMENEEFQEAIYYVAKRKKVANYNDLLDFLFCEIFPVPWRYKCFQYYNDKGKRLKDEGMTEDELNALDYFLSEFVLKFLLHLFLNYH